MNEIRTFETGATRDTDEGKYDYEGFLSPQVIERFAAYMHKHQKQSDGEMRASDNWQKGIPVDQYMKSMYRHFMDLWMLHRGMAVGIEKEEILCALMFNVQGMLFEELRGEEPEGACACSAKPVVAGPEVSKGDTIMITKCPEEYHCYSVGDRGTVAECISGGVRAWFSDRIWAVDTALGCEFEIVEEIKIGGSE